MRRFLVMLGYGIGGLALAVALTLGGYALAGKGVGQPTNPRPAPSDELVSVTSEAPTEGSTESPEPRESASPEDHGGEDNSGPGSGSGTDDSPEVGDDHGGDTETVEPGDDGGSSNSGSGSDSSGSGGGDDDKSGSDSSGSGGGDDHRDDD